MTIFFHRSARAAVTTLVLSACGLWFLAGCSKVLGDRPGEPAQIPGPVTPCSGTGGAGSTRSFPTGSGFAPVLSTIETPPDPPPPMSGGTLLVLGDGHTAVASDPDRDQIWIADLATGKPTASVALGLHDEPGRLVEDAAGRVHVVLRRGGALITVDPHAGTLLTKRAVCPVPRGVAYDPGRDLVYVACLGGELVSLPAAGGPAARTLSLRGDLRDVVLDGDNLLVSRFRSGDVLVVDAGSGQLSATINLSEFSNPSAHGGARFTPSTAWRMRPSPGGGATLLHQRGVFGPIVAGPGGYGSTPGNCDEIVQTALTPIKVGQACPSTNPITGMVLAIDFALSSDGSRTAVIAAGNAQNPQLPRLFVARTGDLTADVLSSGFTCGPDGVHSPAGISGAGGNGGTLSSPDAGLPGVAPEAGVPSVAPAGGRPNIVGPDTDFGGKSPSLLLPQPPQPAGEVEAVAFDGNDRVVIQTREPATLQMPELGVTIALSEVSRADTGHALFHANSGAGIACASCHAEGQEDGRIWEFDCLGPRRTMSISGGISTRTPYHWTGDLPNFPSLMQEVYVGRMSGQLFGPDVVGATLQWIDSIPRLPPVVGDPAAVARGQVLFDDPTHGCISCHNGPHMTNNQLRDVGTGGTFKVPALTGLAWQAPYLHNGCASTLADRFGSCGGGDQHGVTSNLSSQETADLIAYLQSL
jgi:mono/diheme cytochrome c family protein